MPKLIPGAVGPPLWKTGREAAIVEAPRYNGSGGVVVLHVGHLGGDCGSGKPTMETSTKKDPNPKPQTLHLKGTKPYIHNPKMHKLNPKKIKPRKIPMSKVRVLKKKKRF